MGGGGGCQFTRAALPFPTHWTGLDWTGRGASLESRGSLSVPWRAPSLRLRFSLLAGRWTSLLSRRRVKMARGSRPEVSRGPRLLILHPPLPASPPSTTHLTRLSPLLPPLPGSSATPLPPQVTLKEAPPPVPPSTPPAPPRPLPGTANILRPAFGLHYITQPAAPPGVALHHTPFCASDLFRPRPSPSSSKAGLHLRRLLCSRMPFDW